jgi:hypothetical protein
MSRMGDLNVIMECGGARSGREMSLQARTLNADCAVLLLFLQLSKDLLVSCTAVLI